MLILGHQCLAVLRLRLLLRDGNILLGTLGRVYFVDWDQLRERTRIINVMILGE